jgi:hypothetical protein
VIGRVLPLRTARLATSLLTSSLLSPIYSALLSSTQLYISTQLLNLISILINIINIILIVLIIFWDV